MLLFINYNNYLGQYKLENTQLRRNYHKINLKNDWARSARKKKCFRGQKNMILGEYMVI